MDVKMLPTWRSLAEHHKKVAKLHLRDLFEKNPQRFAQLSIDAPQLGLLFDYSKNRVTSETIGLLVKLAEEVDLQKLRTSMFRGEPINTTEDRAALHIALRHQQKSALPPPSPEVRRQVQETLKKMEEFITHLNSGQICGFNGDPITAIVNIGIGGSDLGPSMATSALSNFANTKIETIDFVSSLDSTQLFTIIENRGLKPSTTLFIVASKSFSTQETLTNAHTARRWLKETAGQNVQISSHFVATTTATQRALEFGVLPTRIFDIPEWVGGRYSLWSAIGLPIAISIGMEQFKEMLEGAHAMDEHFYSAPFERNVPVLLGLLSIWYRNFFACQTHAILPYDFALQQLPEYLQQLEMESNGKHITRDGSSLSVSTSPIIWGESGSHGQHSFYQLLYQGTNIVPADFLVPAHTQHQQTGHQTALIANALAQSEALMRGKTLAEVSNDLETRGLSESDRNRMAPHMVVPGNQPTTTIVYNKLTPRVLGTLIALYEHKVFVESACWGTNPFDQFGVELGKELVGELLPEVNGEQFPEKHDSSTNGLLAYINSKWSKR